MTNYLIIEILQSLWDCYFRENVIGYKY